MGPVAALGAILAYALKEALGLTDYWGALFVGGVVGFTLFLGEVAISWIRSRGRVEQVPPDH